MSTWQCTSNYNCHKYTEIIKLSSKMVNQRQGKVVLYHWGQ